MTGQILFSMFTALALTIVLETFFGLICGVKGKREYIIIILANIMTNPLVNVIHGFFYAKMNFGKAELAILTAFLELFAIIAEWLVYKRKTDIKKPLAFSAGVNGFSYFSGMLILNFLR